MTTTTKKKIERKKENVTADIFIYENIPIQDNHIKFYGNFRKMCKLCNYPYHSIKMEKFPFEFVDANGQKHLFIKKPKQ